MGAAPCPECGAAAGHLLGCSQGQVFIAPAAATAAPASSSWGGTLEDERLELRLRQLAVPAALVVAWLFTRVGVGRFVLRTFFGMWLHEGGHAAASWLAGYFALPVPWVTFTADERSPLVTLVAIAALLALAFFSARGRHWLRVGLSGAALLVLLVCTLGLEDATARAFITFGGDAGALAFGALLMSTFFARRDTRFYRGALRWGFLVIGAAALVDVTAVWVAARRDFADIPFGAIEGVGLSDASRLVDVYGWAERTMINRYLVVAALAFAGLAVAWVRGLLHQRARVAAAAAGGDPDELEDLP